MSVEVVRWAGLWGGKSLGHAETGEKLGWVRGDCGIPS